MLPALKYAKLSAIALSNSLKLPPDIARGHLAQALEYETWHRYVELANTNTPEKYDFELSPDIANHRLGLFSANLFEMFDISKTAAASLAKAINPFSGLKPKPYRIDLKEFEGDHDGIDLGSMLEMAGGKDSMLDMLHSMADLNPELESLKDITNIDDFQKSMRISHPMNPGAYYDALTELTNWELDDSLYEEEYTYLESSFHLVSPEDGVNYPVYLVSLSSSPGDSGDELFDEIKDIIEGFGGRALVLFRLPVFKKLNDKTFVVVGTFFNGKEWAWTLLTETDPETQSKQILPENFDLESPVPNQDFSVKKDKGFEKHVIYQAVVSGKVDHEKGTVEMPKKISTLSGVGGWQSYMF